MSPAAARADVLDQGTLGFTIESRIIRELGERLVKQPEVALLELIKNSYDADAKACEIDLSSDEEILVTDDGHGMTLDSFKNGWMRIGTSSKEELGASPVYSRVITGEKGIGRFAVRFLGKKLHLESIAFDATRGFCTLLVADFNWPVFDHNADIGKVKVPYRLFRADTARPTGTQLKISDRRPSAKTIDLHAIRTASIGVVTPYHALLKAGGVGNKGGRIPSRKKHSIDPGFSLKIFPVSEGGDEADIAGAVLSNFVLKVVVELAEDQLKVRVYRANEKTPSINIIDKYKNTIGPLYADIRFFPQRKGTFINMPVDGRKAKTWVKDNSGVAVFDRTFRVHPYGTPGDDWLFLSADHAKSARDPRSSIAKKHLVMDEQTRMSTQLNYMLRLPYPQQLVGIVQVAGRRNRDQTDDDDGLIASADREGFVDNAAFRQLRDIVRGAVEAVASADRELQQELERVEEEELLSKLRKETKDAIREIQSNKNISSDQKSRIIKSLSEAQNLAETHDERTRERQASLEIMSLLGVVAGFMTHEFGTALDELEQVREKLAKLAKKDPTLAETSNSIALHIGNLREFVTYSQGYIQGATSRPSRPYAVRPRLMQVMRVFGKYATEREIEVDVEVEADLNAPLVPVSLYNGIALNLYTNALKAVTAKAGPGDRRIVFRAWNDHQNHYLEISDTGVGIPPALRQRIFEPLFTTTASNRDPLGSGLGLGLSLVKRGAESYGGKVETVNPPAGFTTCFRLRLPLVEDA